MPPAVITTRLLLTVILTLALETTTPAQDEGLSDSTWTVDQLARGVRSAMQDFDTVLLEASYTQERDANAFSKKPPLPLTGTGSLTYRGDQDRWFMRNDGYSFRIGTTEVRPNVTITGYDGQIHYSGDDQRMVLGEEGFRNEARPKSLIWETILTYSYLDRAFDRDTAKIHRSEKTEHGETIVFESSWGQPPNQWRLQANVLPERSFLPVTQQLWLNGKPYAESSLERLVPIQDTSHWRPTTIKTRYHQKALGIINEETTIRRLLLPKTFESAAFRYEPPAGIDMIDRRTNLAWHVDPWWGELAEWMGAELDWPRPRLSSLHEFRSYVNDSIDGSTAPPIKAHHWLQEKSPGKWDRPDRRFTVLFFCGDASRLIDPQPRWITELGLFAQVIEPLGGEVIGIATADTSPEAFSRAAEELMVAIPFGIDQAGETSTGKTHEAFQLQHYYSVMIIDADRKIHVLGDGDAGIVPSIRRLLSKEDAKWFDQQIKTMSDPIRIDSDAVREKWLEVRRRTEGHGTITGVAAAAAGSVTLTPKLKLLYGNNPGGYTVVTDVGGTKQAKVDPETGIFTFTELPRGRYELKFRFVGHPEQSAEVLLRDDQDSAVQDFD